MDVGLGEGMDWILFGCSSVIHKYKDEPALCKRKRDERRARDETGEAPLDKADVIEGPDGGRGGWSS